MWFATLLTRILLASACATILVRLGTSARWWQLLNSLLFDSTSSSKAQWQQKVMFTLQILTGTNCDIMFLIVYLHFSYRLLLFLLFVDIVLLLTHKAPYLKAPIITATGYFFNKGAIQTIGTFIYFPLNPYLKISQHNIPGAAQIKVIDEFSEETWQRLWCYPSLWKPHGPVSSSGMGMCKIGTCNQEVASSYLKTYFLFGLKQRWIISNCLK